jgi:hypothetical protein
MSFLITNLSIDRVGLIHGPECNDDLRDGGAVVCTDMDRIAYRRIGNELRMGGARLEPVTPSVSCEIGDMHRTQKPLNNQAVLHHLTLFPFLIPPLNLCHGPWFLCQGCQNR